MTKLKVHCLEDTSTGYSGNYYKAEEADEAIRRIASLTTEFWIRDELLGLIGEARP